MSNEEQIQKLVAESAAKLLEHCDSVRIFVTWHDGSTENTGSFEKGGGNFYAQLGQVQEWLFIQEQYQRNYAKRKDSEEH